MSKKEDKIKVLLEKARGGDVKKFPSLTRAFGRWLRSSFAEEPSQSSARRLIEKFLQNLNKLVRKIEKTENIYQKTKAVEMVSGLVETIYNTTDSGTAIEYIERIMPDINKICENIAGAKTLGDINNLLAELPRQTAVKSPPVNKRKFSPTRKKRAGCVGGGGGGDGGGTITVDNFIKEKIKDAIENKITDTVKDKIKERFGQLKDQIKATTMVDFIIGRVGPLINPEINEILGHPEDEIEIEAIGASKKRKVEHVTEDTIKEMTEKSPVTFRAHWPRYTKPKLPTQLMVHLYSGKSGEKEADAKLYKHRKQINKLDFDTAGPAHLKNGTRISIKPEMPGFRFDAEECIVKWYGNFITVDFRMVPLLKGPFPKLGEKVHGKVRFFVEPLLIAEINISVIIKEQLSQKERFIEDEETISACRKIFPSYSRKDLKIVKKIEKAYKAMGDEYMRDLVTLRSGDPVWSTLRKLIKEADVFQLFWSYASKESDYVEKEWREALKRRRMKKKFIRPVYWEEPMPEPIPPELKDIHFQEI